MRTTGALGSSVEAGTSAAGESVAEGSEGEASVAGASVAGVSGVLAGGSDWFVMVRGSELEAGLAGGIGKCFDGAVVTATVAVEDDLAEVGRFGPFGAEGA